MLAAENSVASVGRLEPTSPSVAGPPPLGSGADLERPYAVRLALSWLLTIATLLVIPGCKDTTPIKTILDDPGLNNGKQVQIAGEVTKSPAMPGSDAFEVDDGTGKVFVLSKEHGTPPEGTKVVVKGVFYAAISSKTQTFAAIMETEPRTR